MEKAFNGDSSGIDQLALPCLLDNGEFLPQLNSSGSAPVATVGALGGIAYIPIKTPVTCNIPANGNLVNTRFFISDSYYRVSAIYSIIKTNSTGASCSVQVTKDTLGNGAANALSQTPGTGVPLMTQGFDLVGDLPNVIVTGPLVSLSTQAQTLYLNPGDSLSLAFTGTTTTAAGLQVTVWLENTCSVGYQRPAYQPALQTPFFKTIPSNVTSVYAALNAETNTQVMFIANRDMLVNFGALTYTTPFTTGTPTITVTHDTGTQAAGAGGSIFNNAIGVTTANPGLLIATLNGTQLQLHAGDRLSLKYSVTTSGAGVCLTIGFSPTYDGLEVSCPIGILSGDKVSQEFFIADRNYEVVDGSCVFQTAAGSASNVAITIEKTQVAPGAGNVTQTDNTNTGFDVNGGTAFSAAFMTPATRHLRLLSIGDRLGILVTGAAPGSNLCVTVSLRPRS
jgi:hypothetical protein